MALLQQVFLAGSGGGMHHGGTVSQGRSALAGWVCVVWWLMPPSCCGTRSSRGCMALCSSGGELLGLPSAGAGRAGQIHGGHASGSVKGVKLMRRTWERGLAAVETKANGRHSNGSAAARRLHARAAPVASWSWNGVFGRERRRRRQRPLGGGGCWWEVMVETVYGARWITAHSKEEQ